MNQNKPTRHYIARSEPATRGSGYVAVWGAPGLTPAIVKDEDGRVMLFASEEDAEAEARLVLFNVLGKTRARATDRSKRYKKMTGSEFAIALADVNIGPDFFAYVYGTSPKRVLEWIDGVLDVPHPARVLLALFELDPSLMDVAEKVTEAVTTERQPRRISQ